MTSDCLQVVNASVTRPTKAAARRAPVADVVATSRILPTSSALPSAWTIAAVHRIDRSWLTTASRVYPATSARPIRAQRYRASSATRAIPSGENAFPMQTVTTTYISLARASLRHPATRRPTRPTSAVCGCYAPNRACSSPSSASISNRQPTASMTSSR